MTTEDLAGKAPLPTTTFAGPFLRYQNVLPGTKTWLGSVLFLTKADGLANGGAVDEAGSAPRLVLEDELGKGAAAPSCGPPTLLDTCLGWSFWRFELELQLSPHERPVQYSVQGGGSPEESFQFWLPAEGGSYHAAYYSCNGFSDNVLPGAPERLDPFYLWRDLLAVHSAFPMHALIGGGDQLYSDAVWKGPAMRAWAAMDDRSEKLLAPFTKPMRQQSEEFYLHNYIGSFMKPEVRAAFASIPGVMMWDDHDVFDGVGSYPDDIQGCPVFQGLFAVAKRFYLLFQQHTTPEFNATRREMFGDGEYHWIKSLGPEVALVGIDMRSRRTKCRIMPEASYELLERAVLALPASVRHLIVMSGVPLVFPRLPLAETILEGIAHITKTSKMIRAMARNTGAMDPNVNTPEILDDLVDGWAANVHKGERLAFIRLLQSFSEKKGMRVSVLSGDAHVGGVGQLYSHPKYKDLSQDPLYMPQIISSAIVNGPPPHPVIRMMVRTNFANNVDGRTREKLVRLFKQCHPKFHKLLGQRNWCDISLVVAPHAPPTHPDDTRYGALRFQLRCEDPLHRRGHAEETYEVFVPRLRPKVTGTVAPEPAGHRQPMQVHPSK